MNNRLTTLSFVIFSIIGIHISSAQIGYTRPQLGSLYGQPVGDQDNATMYAHNGYIYGAVFNASGLCETLIIQKTQDGSWNSNTVKLTKDNVIEIVYELSGNLNRESKWQPANSASGGIASVMSEQAKKNDRINFVFVTDNYKLCCYMMYENIITLQPNHEGDIAGCQNPTKIRDMKSMTIAEVLSQRYSVTPDLLTKKLDQIIIPKLNCVDVSANDLFEYLCQKSIQYDKTTDIPSSLGVRFKISPSEFKGRYINLNVKDIPLREAIKYISAAFNAYSKINDDGFISILPLNH